jgi:hypothetical protein
VKCLVYDLDILGCIMNCCCSKVTEQTYTNETKVTEKVDTFVRTLAGNVCNVSLMTAREQQ